MKVWELIEMLEGYEQDEQVVVGVQGEFEGTSRKAPCDLAEVVGVDEGMIYDKNENVLVILIKED